MTGKQTAVLWMGILLIAAQFYFGGQWSALFSQIKSKSGPPPKTQAPAQNKTSKRSATGTAAGSRL